MVDRHRLVLGVPALRLGLRIAEQRFHARVVRRFAEHRIEFAVEQHRHDLLSRGRALGGVLVFRHVRILERDPVDAVEIDAIVVGEDAANPGAGRGGEGANADALAVEVGGRQRPFGRIVDRVWVLEASDHGRRQQRQAVCRAPVAIR